MGWPIFIAGLVGVTIACLRLVLDFLDKIFKRELLTSPFNPEFIPLVFMAVFFLATARFQVKFPRYLLPLYPMFFVFAASVLAPRGRRRRVLAAASPAPEPAAAPPQEEAIETLPTPPAQEP